MYDLEKNTAQKNNIHQKLGVGSIAEKFNEPKNADYPPLSDLERKLSIKYSDDHQILYKDFTHFDGTVTKRGYAEISPGADNLKLKLTEIF